MTVKLALTLNNANWMRLKISANGQSVIGEFQSMKYFINQTHCQLLIWVFKVFVHLCL